MHTWEYFTWQSTDDVTNTFVEIVETNMHTFNHTNNMFEDTINTTQSLVICVTVRDDWIIQDVLQSFDSNSIPHIFNVSSVSSTDPNIISIINNGVR